MAFSQCDTYIYMNDILQIMRIILAGLHDIEVTYVSLHINLVILFLFLLHELYLPSISYGCFIPLVC